MVGAVQHVGYSICRIECTLWRTSRHFVIIISTECIGYVMLSLNGLLRHAYAGLRYREERVNGLRVVPSTDSRTSSPLRLTTPRLLLRGPREIEESVSSSRTSYDHRTPSLKITRMSCVPCVRSYVCPWRDWPGCTQ